LAWDVPGADPKARWMPPVKMEKPAPGTGFQTLQLLFHGTGLADWVIVITAFEFAETVAIASMKPPIAVAETPSALLVNDHEVVLLALPVPFEA
jgi:hypothetical protein